MGIHPHDTDRLLAASLFACPGFVHSHKATMGFKFLAAEPCI
jgi:hypothetical protein